MQETWAIHGVYPNMDFTPDSRSIVFWAGGKIRRVNIDGTGAAEIPFQVSDTREVVDPPRPQVNAFSETFTTKMPRFASLSPDGRRVVFESLGRIYIKDAAGGAPRALTASDGDFQLDPSWSRDGSRIAFISWNDQRLGEIRTVGADGSGMRTLTTTPGHYRRPRFSPDGQTIVFERGGGGYLTSARWSEDKGVFRMPASGGAATLLVRSGGNPHFGAAGDRVYVEQSGDNKLKLVSVDMNGKDPRTHAQGEMAVEYQVSPAGDHLAFRENYNIFVVPFFAGAKTLDVSAKGNQLPVARRPMWVANICTGPETDLAGAWARRSTRPLPTPLSARTASSTRRRRPASRLPCRCGPTSPRASRSRRSQGHHNGQ
jgi:Tol biopolymer transport system component